MRFAVLLLIGSLAAPTLSAQRAVPSDGQWLIEPADQSGKVQLTIRYGDDRHSSNWGRDVALSEFVGLSAADMRGSGEPVHFKIVRSAGTLTCEGWFEDGKGSGHFTYQPNADFVAELAKRGIGAPTAWDQFQMTMAGVGLELVDELQRQGYDRPTAGRARAHGDARRRSRVCPGHRSAGIPPERPGEPGPDARPRCGSGIHRVIGRGRLQEPECGRARAHARSRCRPGVHRVAGQRGLQEPGHRGPRALAGSRRLRRTTSRT